MKYIFPFIICLLLNLSSTANASLSPDTEAQMQQTILHEINAYRAKHHLNPLMLNALISIEAKQHSVNIATHREPFGHQYFAERIRHLNAKIPGCNGGAENIAYNYQIPALVAGWIKSPGHRQNILGHYNLTGIGIADDNKGRHYYTQIFIQTSHPLR